MKFVESDKVFIIGGEYKGKTGEVATVSKKKSRVRIHLTNVWGVPAEIPFKHLDLITPEKYPELYI